MHCTFVYLCVIFSDNSFLYHCISFSCVSFNRLITFFILWLLISSPSFLYHCISLSCDSFNRLNPFLSILRPPLLTSSPVTHAVDERGCLTWSSSYTECCYVTYQTTGAWLVIDLGTPLRVHVVVIGSKKFFTDTEVTVADERIMMLRGNCGTMQLVWMEKKCSMLILLFKKKRCTNWIYWNILNESCTLWYFLPCH